MSRSDQKFEYDVALSFAGEDRAYVKQVADLLKKQGIRVFYDGFEQTNLWGKDLYVYLTEVYRNKARYCLMFLSQHYTRKLWTNHERKSAQARDFLDDAEYILPVRLDDTEIPGVLPTIGYIEASKTTLEELASIVLDKVGEVVSISAKRTTKKSQSTRVPASTKKHYSFRCQQCSWIIDGSVCSPRSKVVLLDNVAVGMEKPPTSRAEKPILSLELKSHDALTRMHRLEQVGEPVEVLLDLYLALFRVVKLSVRDGHAKVALKKHSPFIGNALPDSQPDWIRSLRPKNSEQPDLEAMKSVIGKVIRGSRIVVPKDSYWGTEKPPSVINYKKLHASLEGNHTAFRRIARAMMAYALLSTGIVSRIRRIRIGNIQQDSMPVELEAYFKPSGYTEPTKIRIKEQLTFR